MMPFLKKTQRTNWYPCLFYRLEANLMKQRTDGSFSIAYTLEDQKYQFRYLFDKTYWIEEPDCDGTESNPFGSKNLRSPDPKVVNRIVIGPYQVEIGLRSSKKFLYVLDKYTLNSEYQCLFCFLSFVRSKANTQLFNKNFPLNI